MPEIRSRFNVLWGSCLLCNLPWYPLLLLIVSFSQLAAVSTATQKLCWVLVVEWKVTFLISNPDPHPLADFSVCLFSPFSAHP